MAKKKLSDEQIVTEQSRGEREIRPPMQARPDGRADAAREGRNAPAPSKKAAAVAKKNDRRDARTEDKINREKNARREREMRDERRREDEARRDERREDKEMRRRDEEKRRNDRRREKELRRCEREKAKKERAAYRETHPGFYDSSRRIHGFFSVALGVLGLFVLLSFLIRDFAGVVGTAIASALLGCFSWAAYLFPIFMLIHAITWRTDIRERTLVRKAIAFLPALIVTAIFACILTPRFNPNGAYNAAQAYYNGATYLVGGGVVGELLGNFLYRTIGIIGIVLIALAVYVFFFALHFRTPVKIGYALLRARIKEARVERAKRREERREEKQRKEAEEAKKAPEEEEESEEEQAPRTAPKGRLNAPLFDMPTPEEKAERRRANTEKATARRRAVFTDFEDGLDIERDNLSTSRGKQVFDFDVSDAPVEEDNLPTVGGASRTALTLDSADADFGENTLTVKRERVRPVRVSDPIPENEPAQDMDYFRQITVEADKKEVESVEPWVRPTTAEPNPVLDDEEDEGVDIGEIIDQMIEDYSEEPEEETVKEPEIAPAPAPARPARAKAPAAPKKKPYRFPPLSLLHAPEVVDEGNINAEVQANAQKLVDVLDNFRVHTHVTGYSRGPRITRYEIVPEAGIRVRAIAALVDDISMALASAGVRIEAPIPGKAAVGVEVPNANPAVVRLRSMLDSDKFRKFTEKTMVCLGADVTGQPVYCDLAKMPHLLIAGATGMGKSVCVNCILTSILYKATPDELKLILIDPKKVEFSVYRGIPHLLVPVVTDPKKAAGSLSWAVSEMERRYEILERVGVPNIKDYNRYVEETGDGEPMARIVIVIDELADLMMSAKDAVETSIARITAKARAAGIHLIIGTQRPSVDVITGTIKNNIPSRIAMHVPSQADSRTILDFAGAEKLLDKGDTLYAPAGSSKPLRVQGAFVDVKEEIARVVEFLKTNNETDPEAGERIMADIEREAEKCTQKKGGDEDFSGGGGSNIPTDDDDNHLQWAALEVGFEFGRMSTSLLQRKLSIGYGKAAKILDALEAQGLVSAQEGAKPREICITREEFKEMMAREVEKQCGGNF